MKSFSIYDFTSIINDTYIMAENNNSWRKSEEDEEEQEIDETVSEPPGMRDHN